jgi:hypothetical protein
VFPVYVGLALLVPLLACVVMCPSGLLYGSLLSLVFGLVLVLVFGLGVGLVPVLVR